MDLEIQAEVAALTRENYTPAQIHRHLDGREEFRGRVPHPRTIQRIVRDLAPKQPRTNWHWSDYSAEDARILFTVLDALIEMQINADDADTVRLIIQAIPGFPRSNFIPDRETADWIVKVTKVGPGLEPLAAYWIALMYLRYDQMRLSPEGIDTFLVMRPWQDMASARRYLSALSDRLVPPMDVYGNFLVRWLMNMFQFSYPDQQPPQVEQPPGEQEPED